MLLLCREARARLGDTAAVRPPVRRTALTVAQAEPERIAGARQQLRELLHDWADGDQVDSAVLLVSEMVTNVLVHTDGDALLVAEVDRRQRQAPDAHRGHRRQRRPPAQAPPRRTGLLRPRPAC